MIVDHYGVVHVPMSVGDDARPACMLGDFEDDVTIGVRVPARAPTCLWCATICYPIRLRHVSGTFVV